MVTQFENQLDYSRGKLISYRSPKSLSRVMILKWIIFIVGMTSLSSRDLTKVPTSFYDDSYRLNAEIRQADSLMYQEKFADAEQILRSKLNSIGESQVETKLYILNQLTYVNRRLRNYKLAANFLNQAVAIQSLHNDRFHLERVRSLYYQADLLFFTPNTENSDTAIMLLTKAAEIADSILPEIHIDRIFGLVLQGRICYGLDKFSESIEYYTAALQLQREVFSSPHPEIAYSYRQLGINYRGLHDFKRAESYLLESVRIFDLLDEAPAAKLSLAYTSLANAYYEEDLFKKAIPYYQRAINHALVNGLPEYLIATPMANLGTSYSELDSLAKARRYFEEALRINNRSGNLTRTANAYEQFGEFYQRIGDLDSAEYCFLRALKFQPKGAFVEVSDLFTSLAKVAHMRKDVQGGLRHVESAMASLNVFDQESSEFALGQLNDVPEALLSEIFHVTQVNANLLHLGYRQNHDKEMLYEAVENYEVSENLSDQIRNGAYSDASKLLLSQSLKSGAENAIRCYADLYQLEPDSMQLSRAFDLMEKNRYARMAMQLDRIQQSESSAVPDSLIRMQKLYTSEIEKLRQQLVDDPDNKELQSVLFQQAEAYQQFRKEMAEEYPSYFQIEFDSMIDLRQLQQMLTPEQQILEYFWGDSIIAILSITKENCHFDIQKNTGDFRLKLEQLFNWILSDTVLAASNSQQRYRRFAELSHEVYRVLLGNLRDPQKSTLLISPDGLLSQMPFEMLITNKDGQDFRAAPYLLREVNIQYAFSSNLHFKLDDHQRVSKPSVLAFAYSDQRTDHSSEVRNQMMEIPESGMEVKRIRKILGGTKSDYFTGTDATESNFKQNLDDQDIIHLALHGIGDVESELNSRLIFRPDGDEENDGWLYTHELYYLDLSKVRMAVLSACETGIGKEYPGEGMFSMAHGFARSGCSGVVMSLWQAVDANTAEVMDFFYQNIKAGRGSAEALRQAKLQYLDETEYSMNTPPYYWAAFVHIGDADPIVNTKTYPAIFWMLAILLIAILIYVLTKRLN